MNANTQRLLVAGPAGALDVAVDAPAAEAAPRGIAIVCHPHPQHGGTMVGDVMVHNFDPVFAPDGTVVFASTRAGGRTLYKYLPNSNLYRVAPASAIEASAECRVMSAE